MTYVTLSNGIKMPQLDYGVYQVTQDECERCVLDALEVGYRHLDTAQSYFNEEQVGDAIAKSGVDRSDIFLTTKVWIEHYGEGATEKSVEESMRKLKTSYLDLVLLHQPFGDAYGAWRDLTKMYKAGKIRAIGISNFYVERIKPSCAEAERQLTTFPPQFAHQALRDAAVTRSSPLPEDRAESRRPRRHGRRHRPWGRWACSWIRRTL